MSHAAASDSRPEPATLLTDGSAPANRHPASSLNNTTTSTNATTNHEQRHHTHKPPDAYPEVTDEVSTVHTLKAEDRRSTNYRSHGSSVLASLTEYEYQRRRSSEAEKFGDCTSKPSLRAPLSRWINKGLKGAINGGGAYISQSHW